MIPKLLKQEIPKILDWNHCYPHPKWRDEWFRKLIERFRKLNRKRSFGNKK